jgi:hypothetical protein
MGIYTNRDASRPVVIILEMVLVSIYEPFVFLFVGWQFYYSLSATVLQ